MVLSEWNPGKFNDECSCVKIIFYLDDESNNVASKYYLHFEIETPVCVNS